MSHIVRFSVTGLAAKAEPYTQKLDRHVNIFFELNGTGKTSLLKILHSAMSGETDFLERVPFRSAEVTIYSIDFDREFTRVLSKPAAVQPPLGRYEVPTAEFEASGSRRSRKLQWKYKQAPPSRQATGWRETYLPTWRLHTYEIENLLFLHGDLANAAGAAACLDVGLFGQHFAHAPAWCARAAACWQRWVTLCAFAALRARNSGSFYNRPHSQINQTPYSQTNHAAFRNEVMSFEADWADPTTPFNAAFTAVEGLVRRAYDAGEADRFFRGKWYIHFLYDDVRRLGGQRQWHRTGFHDRVLSCLAMTIDNKCAWVRDVRARIEVCLS